MNKKYIPFPYVKNKGFITHDFLNQVFINLFKIWLIITVCHGSDPDFQMPVSQVTRGLAVWPASPYTVLRGKKLSVATGLCW